MMHNPRFSPADYAHQRTKDALARLALDPSTFFRLPIPSLDALCGSFAPQELIVIGGRPGNGKSLFAHNIVSWYRKRSIPIYIMGTEQSADVLSIKQACVECGIKARLILKPSELELGSGLHEEALNVVRDYVTRVLALDESLIQWSHHEYMNAAALEEGTRWAVEEMGVGAVIIDHIHHMRHGSGRNPVDELTETVHLAKHLAKRHGITVIAFAQLRRRVDISTFEPPDMEDFGGSSAIERTADVALGLWRPLRLDMTREQIKELRAKARDGKDGDDKLYEPNTMGVRLLKDRLGDVFGKQALVSVQNGRLAELAERDRYSTQFGAPDALR